MPAAILFSGVLLTVLIGVHVVIVAMARTAVQAAADAAVAAAQAAGPGAQKCDGEAKDGEAKSVRECEGIVRARLALAASGSSVVETHPPMVLVEHERGVVTVTVFGGTLSPVLGGLEFTAQACGPLDDVPAAQLTGTEVWQCYRGRS